MIDNRNDYLLSAEGATDLMLCECDALPVPHCPECHDCEAVILLDTLRGRGWEIDLETAVTWVSDYGIWERAAQMFAMENDGRHPSLSVYELNL